MLLTAIQSLVNSALAGELLTYTELVPHLDAAIDGINDVLNAKYPSFSELPMGATEYTHFPDKYIRTVVVPGCAWHYYVADEEGMQTAPQYQMNYEQGKFIMLRDMLYNIPLEYQADEHQGYVDATTSPFEERGISLNGSNFTV